jgi:hypothetical protein
VLVPGPGTILVPPPGATTRVARASRSIAAAAGVLALLDGSRAATMTPLYLRPPDAVVGRRRS